MNRYKKEERLKHDNIRKGLSTSEIKHLDHDKAIEIKINQLARSIHIERFPEEYDCQLDSIADANDRKRGINPMSDDYIAKVNETRINKGVAPLSDTGLAVSDDSFKLAYAEAEAIVRDRTTK